MPAQKPFKKRALRISLMLMLVDPMDLKFCPVYSKHRIVFGTKKF